MTTTQAPEYELRYQPVPFDKHRSILYPIRDGLLQRKFAESSIRHDYIFTPQRKDKVGLKVHQAAFTNPQRWDPSTSAVNFYYNPDDTLPHPLILQSLAISGAPFNLIGGDDSASLYILSQNGEIPKPHLIEPDITYEQVPQLFARYRADIAPQRIRRAKQGIGSFVLFREFNPLQLRLFAVKVTRDVLVEQFSSAVSELRSAMGGRASHEDEMNIAVQLLAAVILAHKGILGERCSEPDAPLGLVIDEAHRRFSRYFTLSDIEQYNRAAERTFAILQQVRYGSFTPDILEALYIAAYPEAELRKWEGRYNTPLYLTHRILENIPVETIPPAQRIVADMTCGVGNFLQAAYERLSELTDMEDSGRPLREHIFGNDKDEFTAQLAGLSLLLTSHADWWHIDHQDALQWHWLSQNTPTIVVGNPPFGGSRHYQRANAFLERAIQRLAPGGYLAMVMPQSFSVGVASPATRKLLVEQCDVLEIWELPNEVFPDATVRPMVLFAQRKPENEAGRILAMPVRVRTVQRETLKYFEQQGAFTASSIVVSQEEWGPDSRRGPKTTHLMRHQIILSPKQWSAIQQRTCRLDEVADMISGAGTGTERPEAGHKKPERVNWLPNAKKSMPRPYYIQYGTDTIIYPNELKRPRMSKKYLLAGNKVLLVSDPDPSWGQRVKVAIERRGYYPSESFWVLAPKREQPEHITLEVLAAVVSWYVSNAWIVEHLKAPKVPSDAIKSTPFPRKLSAADCQKLESAVHQLEAAAQYDQSAPDAQRTIDQVLKEAYQLDDTTFERLRMVANWHEVDPATVKRPRPNPAKLVFVTGDVEDVDAQNGMITLWLNGFAGLHKTPITDEMPGWMLRQGAAFRAEISEEDYRRQSLDGVVWAHIAPQEYTYMTEDELLEHLDASFSETSSVIAVPE
jgi:hypothetical protein